MSQYNKQKQLYPVITIVLYFGNERWNHNKSLKEYIYVLKEMEEYVNDNQIHVCEVLELLSAVTADDRWEQVYKMNEVKVSNMCEVLDRMHQQGAQIKAKEIAQSLLDVLDIATIAEKRD